MVLLRLFIHFPDDLEQCRGSVVRAPVSQSGGSRSVYRPSWFSSFSSLSRQVSGIIA